LVQRSPTSAQPPSAPGKPPTEAEEKPGAEPLPDSAVCPKCRGKLIDPEGLGWCLVCGYCRSTADKTARLAVREGAVAPKNQSLTGIVECGKIVGKVLVWCGVEFAVIAGLVVLALAVDARLPSDSPRTRAIWSTAQIIVSVVVLVIAQLWALVQLAPRDDRLGMWDAIIPFKLWNIGLKELPRTRGPVFMAAWALTLLCTAIFVIGGLSYWLPKKPGEKKASAPPAASRSLFV
jgi:hypothetical protein